MFYFIQYLKLYSKYIFLMFDIVILSYNNTDINFYMYAYTNPVFYQLSDQQTLAMNVCRLYAFLMDDRSGEPIRKKDFVRAY